MIALPIAIGFRVLSLFGVKDALAKKLAPLAAVVLGLLVLALAVFAFNVWLGDREEAAVDRGATIQREGDLRETLNRVEQANEARETVRRDSSAAYDECLQSARTPANCVGLLPQRAAD